MIVVKIKSDSFKYKAFDEVTIYQVSKNSNQLYRHLMSIVWDFFEDVGQLPRGYCRYQQLKPTLQNVAHFLFQRETQLHNNRCVSKILVLCNTSRRQRWTEHVVLCVPCFTAKCVLTKRKLL